MSKKLMIEGQPEFFQERKWSAFTATDLGRAAKVPTMLRFAEQAYYVALTRDWARGDGAIVDLGSFAGGSAACLAEGVAQSGRNQVVHGYDKFDVVDFDAFEKRYRRYCNASPSKDSEHDAPRLAQPDGNDLTPVAKAFLDPWGSGTRLYKGAIEELGWDQGDIEVLVMDASKTAASMDRMSAQFFAHLIPGRSIVVQQDFLWWQQPWIAVQMAVLKDYLVPVVHVDPESVSFLCVQAIPEDVISGISVANMSDDEFIHWLRDMKQLVKPFRIDQQMRQLIAAVRANPGTRKAYQFGNKP